MTFEEKIYEAGQEILSQIGIVSQSQFMKRGGNVDNILSIRSGRLARAVLGGLNQREQEGINTITIQGDTAIINKGVRVPYAALHELGGIREITQRMRKFFWAKFFETQDTKWIAMARSNQLVFPARPYLAPAVYSVDIKEILRKKGLEFVQYTITKIVEGARKALPLRMG